MDKIVLFASIALLVLAIRFHAVTHAHTIEKVERVWYERLFTGSRPARDNLTDEGIKNRNKSNAFAIAGFLMLGLYVLLNSGVVGR